MYDIFIKNFVDSSGKIQTGEKKLYSVPFSNNDNALMDPVVKTEMGKTGSMEFGMMPVHPYYNSFLQMKTLMRVVYEGDTIFRGRVLTIDTSPFTGERKVHLEGDFAFFMDSAQEGADDNKREEMSVLNYLKQLIKKHNEQMMDNGTIIAYSSSYTSSMSGFSSYTSPMSGSSSGSGSIADASGASDFLSGLIEQVGGSSVGKVVTVDDSIKDKQINLGEVPGNYSSGIANVQKVNISQEKRAYGSSGWESTMTSLENLMNEYGGCFRTRYSGGKCYLDWLDFCFRNTVNSQPIKVKENMIDIDSSSEVDNLFTALIPIGASRNDGGNISIEGYKENIHGKNNRILVPQIVSLYKDSELNQGAHAKAEYENAVKNYGIIYKTQNFNNAKTPEELWKYAIDWIKDNYIGGLTSFTITALDMHHLNSSSEKYMTGDRVKIVYPDMGNHTDGNTAMITKTLTILSTQYYLHNPEKNQYDIGVSSHLLKKQYGSSSKSDASSGGGGGGGSKVGGGGGGGSEEERKRILKEMELLAKKYVANHKYNGDVYDQIQKEKIAKYGDEEGKKIANTVLNSTIYVVNQGLLAGRSDIDESGHDRNLHNRKKVQSMLLDGSEGHFVINGHVDRNKAYDLSPEQVDAINRFNRVATFDAVKGEFGMRKAIEVTSGTPAEMMKMTPEILRLRVGIGKSTSSSQQQVQGSISLFGKDKMTNDNANPLVSLFGDGTFNGVNINLGPPDPTKTPGDNPTIQQNGDEGSAAFGNNGDLNGWKITINKPMTYKWTDSDGKTQTGRVPAGSIGVDDMHFTKKYDSLRVNLAAVDTLLVDYAKINSLEALKATIDEINTKYITAEDITTDKITAKLVNATISNVSSLSAGDILLGSTSLKGALKNIFFSNPDANGNITVTLVPFNEIRRTFTFKKGDTEAAYKDGWNDCIDAAKAKTCLSGYTTYNSYPTSLYLKNAAYPVTGEAQVWRYGGSVDTYYELPDRK